MTDVLLYISGFFLVFLTCAILSICLRALVWIYIDFWCPQRNSARSPRQSSRSARVRMCNDRQANIFTIADDSIGSNSANRFADFFYLEPTSEEAARIRAQLEKDDRELPTYDDVMRINNVIVPTTLAARPADTSRNTTIDILPLPLSLPPVPPYSEIDPNAILSAEPSTTFGSTSTADCYSVATTSAMCSVTPQSTSVPSTSTDVAMEYTTTTTTTAATTSSAIAGNVPINNIAAIV